MSCIQKHYSHCAAFGHGDVQELVKTYFLSRELLITWKKKFNGNSYKVKQTNNKYKLTQAKMLDKNKNQGLKDNRWLRLDYFVLNKFSFSSLRLV